MPLPKRLAALPLAMAIAMASASCGGGSDTNVKRTNATLVMCENALRAKAGFEGVALSDDARAMPSGDQGWLVTGSVNGGAHSGEGVVCEVSSSGDRDSGTLRVESIRVGKVVG